MTVKEVMEALQKEPEDAQVYTVSRSSGFPVMVGITEIVRHQKLETPTSLGEIVVVALWDKNDE